MGAFRTGLDVANQVEIAREIGFLRTSDEPRLRKFWETIHANLPITFYFNLSPDAGDFRDMAYERYSAALMHPGSVEERVANAIMSLEALLLEEHQELAYRLRLRVAKMFGFLGEEPLAVRDALADAYTVRSRFAHGSRLTANARKKIETGYKSVDAFVLKILNFVRKAIVTSLLVKQPKDDFIDLIDDALIERSAEERLQQLLSTVAETV